MTIEAPFLLARDRRIGRRHAARAEHVTVAVFGDNVTGKRYRTPSIGAVCNPPILVGATI